MTVKIAKVVVPSFLTLELVQRMRDVMLYTNCKYLCHALYNVTRADGEYNSDTIKGHRIFKDFERFLEALGIPTTGGGFKVDYVGFHASTVRRAYYGIGLLKGHAATFEEHSSGANPRARRIAFLDLLIQRLS